VGLREEAWTDAARPVRFEVVLRPPDGGEETLWERTVDPRDAADRRWIDARIDLMRHGGYEVELELRSHWDASDDGFALPVWSDPVVYAPGRAARPNVVLVSVDTLRARSLGSYGYARDTSPFLDEIAAAGSVFEQAWTASVTTSPAHMSLFTGLYPARHGIRRGLDVKRPGVPTLASQLRAAGYFTAAFTENGYLVRRRGFGEGFHQYTENQGETQKAPGEARLTFGQARAWVEAHRELPFFLFVHTYEVHSPYDPEEPHASLFEGDDAPGPADAAIRAARDRYDREIRAVDDELRAFFETLERAGAARDTLVVLTSDHGEEFAEHGGYQHGGAVFEESLRVPLVFWGPGRIPAARRIAEPVSLTDVAPTLLALLDLPVPATLDGHSLAETLRGGGAPAPRPLFAEAQARERWTGPLTREAWNPPLFAVRVGAEKFVLHRPEHGEAEPMRRFDLAADPQEASPQPVAAERAAQIEALLDRHLGAAAPGSAAAQEPGADVTPDLRERLRALGYAE